MSRERSVVRDLTPKPPATLAVVVVPAISHGSSLLLWFRYFSKSYGFQLPLGVLTSVLAVITALARRLGSKRDARIIRGENRLRAFNTFPSISSSPTGGSRCYSKLTVPAPYSSRTILRFIIISFNTVEVGEKYFSRRSCGFLKN